MNKIPITRPLEEYIEILVGHKEYATISAEKADSIKACQGYETLCAIENSDSIITSYTGVELPMLDNGLCRLWIRDAFTRMEHAASIRASQIEVKAKELLAMKEFVAQIIIKSSPVPMPMEFIRKMVSMMNDDDIRKTAVNGGYKAASDNTLAG